MSQEAGRRYIVAIFVLALALRVGYAVVTPAFEAPDEYSHYNYIKFLHEARSLPVQHGPDLRAEELEFHQPPLYYLLLAPMFPATHLIEGRPVLPFRLISILLSMTTFWIAYLYARTAFPRNPFPMILLCIAAALVPTYLYTSSTVRNGVLATLLASLGFYILTRTVIGNRERDSSRWLGIGALGGLAIISMLSAIGFLAAAGLAVLMVSDSWRVMVRRTAWMSVGVFGAAGWWFARNWLVYGSPLTIVEQGYQSVHSSMEFSIHAKAMLITIFKTFWAVFGRINEFHFADIYRFYWWFAGFAVLGLVRYMFQRQSEVPARLLWIFGAAIAASLASTIYYAYHYDSDQGRYLFPTLIPIATFIAIGFNALVPARYHRWVLDTILFAFAGINVLVLSRLAFFYGP